MVGATGIIATAVKAFGFGTRELVNARVCVRTQ